MPFEFTGAPPPRLDAPTSFSSFASSSTAGFAQNRRLPSSPFTTTPTSFSFGSPAGLTQHSGSSSFGSTSGFSVNTRTSMSPFDATLTSFNLGSTWARSSDTQSSEVKDDVFASLPAATDPLSKALVRAGRNRPAVWGRLDIAGDEVVNNALQQGDTFDVPAIVSGLREVEESHPEVARFTRALFDASVRSRVPAEESQAQSSFTSEAATDASDDLTNAVVSASQAPTANTVSQTPPAQIDTPEHPVKIPRHHSQVTAFVEALAERILRGAVVTYPEGAKVLAAHITDLYYNGSTQGDVVAAVTTLLGRPDDISGIADVASYADDGLDALENQYQANKEDMTEEESEEEMSDDEDENEASGEESISDHDCATEVAPPASKPFRFLELPAEMRNLIYRLLLAPDGYIGLAKFQYAYAQKTRHHRNDLVHPNATLRNSCGANYCKMTGCSPQILAVCRQIYEEAKQIMYEENTVCAIGTLSTGALIFSQRLLPDLVLPRLTSMMLVCDAADTSALGADWFSQLPWKQLQQLTGLKSFRISVIEREHEKPTTDSKAHILEQILERIPKACQVTFESREGFEDAYVQEVIDEAEAHMRIRRGALQVNDVYEVEGGVLQELAKEYIWKQGQKSGHERDYRFPDRSISSAIGKLMPLSEVNPKLVLGAQWDSM